MKRRVVVTGLGVISSVGHNVPTFWREISHGRPGIGPMELVDRTQLRCPNAAEVRGFRATDHFEEKQAGLIDRFCQFSLVAAREAAHDAGFTPSGPRCGVVTGS
ncbi:MAG TPA: beta-ketoacyl synthase N-terminal-like domain-containing protein, partial [Bryobacteraceae bacterium]|nr:beta-ketoacyl synthase N-terminal-like domain-containing protein [Bryobacteraceae bacterium]